MSCLALLEKIELRLRDDKGYTSIVDSEEFPSYPYKIRDSLLTKIVFLFLFFVKWRKIVLKNYIN